MVVAGALVKEDCSSESQSRIGTIVRVSDIVLHENSQWEHEVKRWISYNNGNGNREPDMNMCYVIRPGKVASVRWQDDPTKVSIHVFYDDCKGLSFFSHGSNSVEVLS